MNDVKIHVKGIAGSSLVEKGDVPSALFGAVLEVDGHIIETAFKVEVSFEEGFVQVTPHFYPGTFTVVSHDKESWVEFAARMDREYADKKTARDGLGRALAKVLDEDEEDEAEVIRIGREHADG
jgi:hypothetical protein